MAVEAIHSVTTVALAYGHNKEITKLLVMAEPIEKIVDLLNKSGSGSPIQKIISEIIANFITDQFYNSEGHEIEPIDFNYHPKLLKLYQIINHDLLKSDLDELGVKFNTLLLDKYIAINYFNIIGVCKVKWLR